MLASDFEIDGATYRLRRISAARQHALLRLLSPVLPALSRLDAGMRLPGLDARTAMALFGPLRETGEDKVEAVFVACLNAVERADGSDTPPSGLAGLLSITLQVVAANFGKLFALDRPRFDACPTGPNDKGFGELGPVDMPNGEGELYAPMLAGMCAYREVHDGSLQIEDIARMNDLLAVRNENEARLRYAADQG